MQCDAHGSLRMVAKQFSVNAKDLCDISLYQHSQYAAFDRPNKTDVMITTLGKSVTRGRFEDFKDRCKSAVGGQISKKTEENKHRAVIPGCGGKSESLYWD